MAHTIFLDVDDSIVALDVDPEWFDERATPWSSQDQTGQVQDGLMPTWTPPHGPPPRDMVANLPGLQEEQLARLVKWHQRQAKSGAAVADRSVEGHRVLLRFAGSLELGERHTSEEDQVDSSSACAKPSESTVAGRTHTGSSHDTMNSSNSTCSSEFTIPGLRRACFSDSEADDKVYNTVEAHANGTCRPCRFYHVKEEGCRLGDACKFCHICSREEARSERLRVKYDDRRRKRRAGLRR